MVNLTKLVPARLFQGIYSALLACWVGGTVFFSIVVLPTLFRNLERSQAGDVAALLFPGYYRFGLACAVVLLAIALGFAYAGRSGWRAAALVLCSMLACQGIAAGVVRPRMAAIRGMPEHQREFDRLHRHSVRLNAVVLIAGIGLVAAGGRLLREP